MATQPEALAGGNDGGDDSRTLRSETRLPPTQDTREILRRMGNKRSWHNHNKDFNPDTFTRFGDEHREFYKFNEVEVSTGNKRGEGATREVNTYVPAFQDCQFFIDPGDHRKLFVLPTEAGQQGFLARGFEPVTAVVYTDTPPTFPMPTNAHVVATAADQSDLIAKEAPAEIVLPSNRELPALWMMGTTAESIIHAVSVKVYDEATSLIFSPYKCWSREERKKKRIKANSILTKYYQSYWYLHKEGIDPKNCPLKINALAGLATAKHQELFGTKPDWFSLANSVDE